MEFDKATKPYGVKSRRRLNGLNAHVYELPDGVDEVKVLDKLKKDRRFKAVELDRLVEPAQVVTDPLLATVGHCLKFRRLPPGILRPVTVSPSRFWIPVWMALTLIWPPTCFPAGMRMTIIPIPVISTYGTKVAGTATAVANNGAGSSGLAWNARILPVRISMPDGRAYLSDMAKGIRWAADNGARIANISYGGAESLTVQSAANYMRSKGGVVVMSAGNSGGLNNFPASNAIIVASATDSKDARASWSSYGPYVDVAAPV